jgi:hypothetical protein
LHDFLLTNVGEFTIAEVLMKLLLPSLLALGLAASSVSLTPAMAQVQQPTPPPAPQEQPAPPPAPQAQPAVEVSDADIQKFAEIYVDVETTRAQVAEEMNATEEEVPAEEAQLRLHEELAATIEEHGWSVDRYNQVASAISNDPEKRDKAVELINEMVSG